MVSTEKEIGRGSKSLKKKSSLLKKLALIGGGLFGLMVLAAIVVPLVIDVDKYRPQIVSKANEMMNGKLEIGKLGLSLWGRVKVDIDGLKLTDAKGRTVIDVKDAGLNIPLLSFLTGKPELRVILDTPAIGIVKQKDGKLNAMTLMKEQSQTSASGAVATGAQSQDKGKGGSTEVPAFVMAARITVLINNAKLSYKDEITGDSYNVNELNFRLEDVSPSGKMPFEISANLDMLMQKKIKISGPIVFEGSAQAFSSGGAFDRAEAKALLKLDGLEISDPGLFEKKKGVVLGAEMQATVGKDSFNASVIKFRLADVTIDGQASGKTVNETTTIDFKAHSNTVDIAKLGDLVPMIKEYKMNGLVEVAVNASGPTTNLGYGAKVKFNKITLTHESMSQALEVNGALAVGSNELKDFTLKLTAPKNFDLTLTGAMQNFMAPRFHFNLTSNAMDLDGLLKSSAKAAEVRKEAAQATVSNGGAAAPAKQVVDYNAMFEPLRKNPMAAAAAGTIDFSIKRIKSTGILIGDTKGQLALNNLVLALKDFSMQIFDGSIKGGMTFNAKPAKPEVGTNLTVAGIQTQKMLESQVPFARNSIKGGVSANLNIGGSGLNPSDVTSNWHGTGSLELKPAIISSLDIGREVKDGVLGKLSSQPLLSAYKDKIGGIKVPDAVLDKKGEYELILAKFNLANGVMTLTDFTGKAHPNKGFDLKGSGTIKLSDYVLDMSLDVIDSYNVTNAQQTLGGDSRFGGKFAVSPKVGGTAFSPKFDWGSTVGKLAENYAKTKGQEQLKKAIGDKVPGLNKIFGNGGGNNNGGDQKPADAVKGALKGLFGH